MNDLIPAFPHPPLFLSHSYLSKYSREKPGFFLPLGYKHDEFLSSAIWSLKIKLQDTTLFFFFNIENQNGLSICQVYYGAEEHPNLKSLVRSLMCQIESGIWEERPWGCDIFFKAKFI